MRRTGILMHLSSLATSYGIGDMGPAAYKFAEYLKQEGHTLWQILPLTHCGYGNSPYNPVSAFAYNPYLISPELLYEQGLIDQKDLHKAELPDSSTVFYESVYKAKDGLLQHAADQWLLHHDLDEISTWREGLLKPYLAFQMLSKLYNDNAWYHWHPEHRHYSGQLFDWLWHQYSRDMKRWSANQGIFIEQLNSLKDYLASLSISLVGDMPLYLSYESAEVWAQQQLFDLDEEGNRLHFAGVPPDAFSTDGQLWGNPIYRWDRLAEQNFAIFMQRIGLALQSYDFLRLDHFIGYVNYWQVDCAYSSEGIPILPETALLGNWIPARPYDFFDTLTSRFARERFIAEDLGILNADVCNIRDRYGFPGMIVLQFCFEESVPQVQNYPPNRWLYTGTHDNSTLKGWFESLPPDSPSIKHLKDYCAFYRPRDCTDKLNAQNIHSLMRKIALSSACETVIISMQDILGLDETARMNTPGTALGNWQWRMRAKDWEL